MFIKNPTNISKNKLSPTAYKKLSILSKLCSFKILSNKYPGINVKYINPITGLIIKVPTPKLLRANNPNSNI